MNRVEMGARRGRTGFSIVTPDAGSRLANCAQGRFPSSVHVLLSLALVALLAWVIGCAEVAYAFAADAASETMPLQAQGIQVQTADYDDSWYWDHEDDASFTLEDVMDLKGLAHLVNIGIDFQGKTIYLKDNTHFVFDGSVSIDPIGTKENPFKGTFDGKSASGTIIQNLAVNSAGSLSYVGLFGYAEKALIRNLTLSGGKVEVSNSAAGLTISYVGAIAGYLDGSMENCTSSVAVTVTNNGEVPAKKGTTPEELCTITNIGGLVGRLTGNLANCTHGNAMLSINSTAGVTENVPYIAGFVGGLAGFQGVEDDASCVTTTTGCTNTGKLSFNVSGIGLPDRFGNKAFAKSVMVGGIVGYAGL